MSGPGAATPRMRCIAEWISPESGLLAQLSPPKVANLEAEAIELVRVVNEEAPRFKDEQSFRAFLDILGRCIRRNLKHRGWPIPHEIIEGVKEARKDRDAMRGAAGAVEYAARWLKNRGDLPPFWRRDERVVGALIEGGHADARSLSAMGALVPESHAKAIPRPDEGTRNARLAQIRGIGGGGAPMAGDAGRGRS